MNAERWGWQFIGVNAILAAINLGIAALSGGAAVEPVRLSEAMVEDDQ